MQEVVMDEPGRQEFKGYAKHSRRGRFLFSGEPISSWLVTVAVAILRLATGAGIAALHGWQKFSHTAEFVAGLELRGIGLPYVVAILVGGVEVLAGLCLALGLATRLASLFMGALMVGAILIWHAGDSINLLEPALTYLILSVFFLLVGGGRLSLDAALRRRADKLDEDAA